MFITRKSDATFVEKPDGTNVWYYLFSGYEVHYNEIEPGATQVWHCHEIIEEIIYILSGQLLTEWIEKGEKQQSIVEEGDLVQSQNSVHTFTNISNHLTKFLVIKLMLDGIDHSSKFKTDKRVFSTEVFPPI